MFWKVFASCALLASVFRIAHSAADCNTSVTVCDYVLRLRVKNFFDGLMNGRVPPDQLSANCSSWYNCTTFMRSAGCTWDGMYQTLVDAYDTRSNSSVFWYYYQLTQSVRSMSFMCDNATRGYADYYQCYSRNSSSAAQSRCDTIMQAKYDLPFDPHYHYCEYERERATCFYRAINGTCGYEVASYFASIWLKYAESWIGDSSCDNVTSVPIASRQDDERPCDVDGFFLCLSKIPQLINAEFTFYCMSLYGEQFRCSDVTRYGKEWYIFNSTGVCSDWNSFISCSARTGCNVRSTDIENVTWTINKDVWTRDSWQMSSDRHRLYTSFDMFKYTCGEGRGLIRSLSPPDVSDLMCYYETRTKLSYPFYKLFGLCRAIFENAVCAYEAAVAHGCNESYLAATVELRTKYYEMWYRQYNWRGWPLYAPLTTETCAFEFAAVKNASHNETGDRCGESEFVECLVSSDVDYTQNVNFLSQLLDGRLSESWLSTNCKTWQEFHACWQCNNTEIIYAKVDYLAAFIESKGLNRSGQMIDDFPTARALMNEVMTPRRMDLLCFANVSNNVSDVMDYERCISENGGFYNSFLSCISGNYKPSELCSLCERCFRQLYSSIVARCPVKVGVFMLKYLIAEWFPYLHNNKNCPFNFSDIVHQCDEFGCTALLRASVSNYTQLLTNGQLTSAHLKAACSFASDSSSCVNDDIRVRCDITDVSFYRILDDDVIPYLCATSNQQAYLANQAYYATQIAATASVVNQLFNSANCGTVRSSLLNLFATLNTSCGQSTAEAVAGLAVQFRIIATLPPLNTTWCPNLIHPSDSASPLFDGPFYKTSTSSCLDFYFTCRVNYSSSSTDDGARFDVSLTFDGQLATSYKTTNSTQLEVIFTQDDIRGHFGTTVSCAVRSYWVQIPYSKSKFVFSANNYLWNASQCPCDPDRCWNGATCVWNETLNDYSCVCIPGFTDADCSRDIDDCADFPCESFGECVDGINDYSCQCNHGYLPMNSSKSCLGVETDECASDPCGNGGTCYRRVDMYACSCAPGYFGLNCERALPNITILRPTLKDMHPTKGTVAGGALVTITGDNMHAYALMWATFTDPECPTLDCDVLHNRSSPNAIVIITPRANSCYVGKQLALELLFIGGIETRNAPLYFTYGDNPVIEDIQPRVQFANGGILLTVYGKDLDVVYDPRMIVTVEIYAPNASKIIVKHISVCDSNSSSIMFCRMPVLDLGVLFGCNDTRRDGTAVATIRCDNITANLYVGFQLENLPTYRNISKSNPHINFTLIMPNLQFERSPDPVVFNPATDAALTIKGAGFSRGCSRHDYFIMIGSANCSLVDLTDNRITCSPPKEKPKVTSSGFCENRTNTLALTTQIGSNKGNTFFIYCVMYTQSQSVSHVPLILGLCIGLGGGLLLILIVVLTVVVVCRQSRSSETPPIKLQSSDEVDNVYVDPPIAGNPELKYPYPDECSGEEDRLQAAPNDEYSRHVETSSDGGGDEVADLSQTAPDYPPPYDGTNN